ncbi:Yip1 family protein [Porticoccus sp. W117]|uniref:Yip1 family protein n=1 Tax=Porticoccus sp. W117 TaxID=3054777 RepID=UPI002596EAE5|nr:Yip1 family protein [Porticoccus sp. W117]MDM3871643.1 Yip1 family protein [Porticoccus sp. W117]
MFNHIPGLLFNPRQEWKKIAHLSDEALKRQLPYFIVMALIPAVGFYYGTTQVGWSIIGDKVYRITESSALPLTVLFYAAIVGSVLAVGYIIHWMSRTYRGDSFRIKDFVLVGYAMTPVFIAGAFSFYPIFWLDIIIATAACSYMIYQLYVAIPLLLHVPEERGFLFASAVMMMVLVLAVVILGATVILWELGAMPVFIDG